MGAVTGSVLMGAVTGSVLMGAVTGSVTMVAMLNIGRPRGIGAAGDAVSDRARQALAGEATRRGPGAVRRASQSDSDMSCCISDSDMSGRAPLKVGGDI
jgi:hypothetical protein